ncbi:MAG: rRNA maturation RNase YbeY [Sulfurospirillaceae bacterium]|nr:rRNA maturation RNase YbeY [Sulfurospirillaceae bacterium]MDD3462341.1 rRNA maturation RNase YbeY [Sulfurospirillaceae bacterium]
MLIIENETSHSFEEALLYAICDEHTSKEVELVIADDASMLELNLQHRGKDSSTDVLSFPLEDFPHTPLGSIVINIEMAQEKAIELGHQTKDEIALLFIHGLLHLLGYDHECDNGEMREKEEELIEKYALPKSLITRVLE